MLDVADFLRRPLPQLPPVVLEVSELSSRTTTQRVEPPAAPHGGIAAVSRRSRVRDHRRSSQAIRFDPTVEPATTIRQSLLDPLVPRLSPAPLRGLLRVAVIRLRIGDVRVQRPELPINTLQDGAPCLLGLVPAQSCEHRLSGVGCEAAVRHCLLERPKTSQPEQRSIGCLILRFAVSARCPRTSRAPSREGILSGHRVSVAKPAAEPFPRSHLNGIPGRVEVVCRKRRVKRRAVRPHHACSCGRPGLGPTCARRARERTHRLPHPFALHRFNPQLKLQSGVSGQAKVPPEPSCCNVRKRWPVREHVVDPGRRTVAGQARDAGRCQHVRPARHRK